MTTKQLPDEKSKKFIAVLNKKIPTGKLFNALGHMTAGLVAKYPDISEMCFMEYKDKDGGIHPNISHFGFIILKADNSNQIRTVRNECLTRNLQFTDFTSTMTIGTSQEQLDNTRATGEEDLEYYGIVIFGETDELKTFTGKFTLFQ